MIEFNKKPGFALVTVLVLLIGLSLAGAGLTFKLVYEARLVDSWQQREAANSTSETGIESAKRWLESELDKETNLSENSTVINADNESTNYCLKGFKVDEITSLKTETSLLSTELNDENFKNYSYKYFIEKYEPKNINDKCDSNNDCKQNDSNTSNIYFYGGDDHIMYVYDQKTGEYVDSYSDYNGGKGFVAVSSGGSSTYFSSGENMFIHDNAYGKVWVFNKKDGTYNTNYNKMGNFVSNHHSVSIGYGFETERDVTQEYSSFFVDEKYLYILDTKNHIIFVYDKDTGVPANDYNKVLGGNERGFPAVSSPASSSIYVDEKNIFVHDNAYGIMWVFNKKDGTYNTNYNKMGNFIPNNHSITEGYGFSIEKDEGSEKASFVVDGQYIYFYDNQKSIMFVYNKNTGLPAEGEGFIDIYGGKGFPAVTSDGAGSFSISGDQLFLHDNSVGIMWVLNKKDGTYNTNYNKMGNFVSNNHSISSGNGFKTKQSTISRSNFTVENIINNHTLQIQYFRIRSCGFGLNNSVSRIESIYSYSSDTKSLSQISWKELF